MKAYAALVLLAYAAYCHAADKNYGEYCAKDDKCLGDLECARPDGCTYGICACKSGHTRDSGNTCKSVPEKKKFDETCSSSSDCYTNLCTSSKCACPSGTEIHDNKMECGKYVGKTCTTASTDCGYNMDCTSGKCACMAAYKEVDKKCVPYALDEDCSGNKQCLSPGTCTNNKCSCSNSLVSYAKMWCVHKDATKNLGKGDACTQPTGGSGGTISSSSEKICKEGYVCATCPNQSGTKVCMSGAASIQAGILSIAFTAILTFLRL